MCLAISPFGPAHWRITRSNETEFSGALRPRVSIARLRCSPQSPERKLLNNANHMAIEPASSSLGSYRRCLVARRIKHLERVMQAECWALETLVEHMMEHNFPTRCF